MKTAPKETTATANKKRARLRPWLKWVLLVVISVAVGFGTYYGCAGYSGGGLPMPFGVGVAVVESGSMEPSMKVGDMLIVKKRDEIAVGDVIVYRSGRMLVVHRVIAIDGDTLTTKGDANNAADTPFDKSAYEGTVVKRVPFVGMLLDGIKSPIGILLLAALAILLIELSRTGGKASDEPTADELRAEIEELKRERGDNETQPRDGEEDK